MRYGQGSLIGHLLLAAAAIVTVTGAAAAPVDVVEEGVPGLPGRAFLASAVIAAPVETLCRIVQDYPSYGAFMPNTRSAVPVGFGAGHVLVDITLDLPLGQSKQYRLRLEPRQGPDSCRLAWQLVPRPDLRPSQTIADTSGWWEFTPAPGHPGATLARYRVYADPGPVPFGFGWIVDMMSRRSLPQVLDAVRTRAEASTN